MAQPTLFGNLQLVSDCESAGSWSARDGSAKTAIATTSDIVKSGTYSVGATFSGALLASIAYNFGGATDFSNQYLYFWFWFFVRSWVSTRSTGGVRIFAETTGGVKAYWNIGGSDTDWVGRGWRRIVADLNRTPSSTSGTWTATSVQNIQYVGFSVNLNNYSRTTVTAAIDQVHRGSILEITGGTASDPVTFQNVYEWDQGIMSGSTGATATGNKYYGLVNLNTAGQYELAGRIRIGREITGTTGASGTYFQSSNDIIVWQDNPVGTAGNQLTFGQSGAGVGTSIYFGSAVGSTADSKVGYDGTVMYGISDLFEYSYGLNFTNSVNRFGLYGTAIYNAYDGINFAPTTDHEFISNSFLDSGQVTAGSGAFRECVFSRTNAGGTVGGGGTGAALLWNDNIDIKKCRFLANTDSTTGTSGPYAIQHSTTGSYDYIALEFSGNDHDIYCTVASDTLTINATEFEGITSNPTTYNTAGATVDIQNTVTVTVRNVTSGREPNSYARIYIETAAGGPASAGVEILRAAADTADEINAGRYKATTQYNYSTNQPVTITARYKGYLPFTASGTITGDGLDVNAVWLEDTIVDV